jgi:hypothetical protein
MFHPPHFRVAALPLHTTGPSFDHILKICTVRFTQRPMENSDCGIAASADLAARAGKFRYDVEMNWKFQFFSHRASSRPDNQVMILRIASGTSNFYCQTGNLAKPALARE